MSFLSGLYELIIGPLELFFEVIFSIVLRIEHRSGVAICILSLCMNFLLMPLYTRTDAIQDEARNTETRIRKGVNHIKKTFHGNERIMMLDWFYHLNNYKPTDILKGSVSLLLEIPFFIAAYNFLSNLSLLQGAAFGPIQDLSSPDAMLTIAGISINLLPIMMTVFNIISSFIYTKGLPLSSKIQLYGMAGLFLLLLYDSPSGLVLYWTLNNLFSLAKNVFIKLRNPGFVLKVLSSIAGILMLFRVFFFIRLPDYRCQMLLICAVLLLQLPLILHFVHKKFRKRSLAHICTVSKNDHAVFYLGCLFMTLLTGVLIPSAVIADSPQEFLNSSIMRTPLFYIRNSSIQAAGLFLLWPLIFYSLATPKMKKTMGVCTWILSGLAVINYMFFSKAYGLIQPNLQYEYPINPSVFSWIFNIIVIVVASLVLYIVWKKKTSLLRYIYITVILAIAVMGLSNMIKIQSVCSPIMDRPMKDYSNEKYITLSKSGNNVCIFMMDRAINNYLPYIFQEMPQVAEQFDGFTYYPNTISYGAFTNTGAPALFGGYEYRPREINARDDVLLKDKHNEALLIMPRIFSENDFQVSVCDPAYANYSWVPDLSIYDPYPEIETHIVKGNIHENSEIQTRIIENIRNRNFFCHSIFKISPVITHLTFYNDGFYNALPSADDSKNTYGNVSQTIHDIYHSDGLFSVFMDCYEVLTHLTEMTAVVDDDSNHFFITDNDTTHEPMLLQEPDYVPSLHVDNSQFHSDDAARYTLNGRTMAMKENHQVIHYHANAASYIQLGKWLDFLRENDVYDNTRIIIVSDHGRNLHQFEDMLLGEEPLEDLMFYNPLLLVKDFNSKGFTVDHQFMTNADVPTLATADLIQDPVNPFTNNPINSDPKTKEDKQYIFGSLDWSVYENNGTTYLPGDWFSVHDNIYDLDNWEHLK